MPEILTNLTDSIDPWMIVAIIAGALIIIAGIGIIWRTGRKAWGLLTLASGGGLSFTPALLPTLWNRFIDLGPLAGLHLPAIPTEAPALLWPLIGVIAIAAVLSIWLLTVLGRAVFDMRVTPVNRRRTIRDSEREYDPTPGDFDTLDRYDTGDGRRRARH